MVRSRCGGKGCGWRDGCVLDIADITSGEERRGERAEVLGYFVLGGEYRDRSRGGVLTVCPEEYLGSSALMGLVVGV